MHHQMALCLALLVSAQPVSSLAQALQDGPAPENRLLYRSTTAVRVNPILGLTELKLTYRHRLYRSAEKALSDNFVGAGVSGAFTPAGFAEGAHVEVAPASFLQFSASADLWQWFGNFNYINSWAYADDNWGPNEVARRGALPVGDPERNYSTTGYSFTVSGLLQGRFGPVVARSNNRLMWTALNLREGDRVFYDPLSDLAAPNKGFTIVSENDVAYSNGRLLVGVRLALAQALYRAEDFSPGAQNPNVLSARLGPVALWRFFEQPTRLFNPALALSVTWFLSHRFRAGVDVSRAIPQVGLSFVFWGDILEVPAPDQR